MELGSDVLDLGSFPLSLCDTVGLPYAGKWMGTDTSKFNLSGSDTLCWGRTDGEVVRLEHRQVTLALLSTKTVERS